MPRFLLTLFLLSVCGLIFPPPTLADKITAAQMQQLLQTWPPNGWHLTPPGADAPFPAYIADGEFSGTIYRQNTPKKLWSAHLSITDQQTPEQAKRMLNNFLYCEETQHKNYPARTCTTLGEDLGRRSLAYAVERYLIEISVIGPIPLQLPELDLKIPNQ